MTHDDPAMQALFYPLQQGFIAPMAGARGLMVNPGIFAGWRAFFPGAQPDIWQWWKGAADFYSGQGLAVFADAPPAGPYDRIFLRLPRQREEGLGLIAAALSLLSPDGILLVADEVQTGFARTGRMFGIEHSGVEPDMITVAKGLTSGYSPLGAMIASDRLMEPFLTGREMFAHGYTFGGHPVSTAVGLRNLQIFEDERLLERVRENEGTFRATLERLKDLPIVGDVRGDGFFYGIELVKDKATKETFTAEESERLLYGFVSKQLFAEGLYCRADDRGDPVVQLAPPLICGPEHFEEMEQILRVVLDKAGSMI